MRQYAGRRPCRMSVSQHPNVSVIIAAKDVAEYIVVAVRSALAQTVRDIEVLVVDDGSVDDTAALVRAIDDPRLSLLSAHGQGWPRARNLAMKQARGRVFAFLDGDDEWLPHHLARVMSELDAHPAWDLVFAAATWIGEQGEPLPRTVVRSSGTLGYERLFLEFPPVTCSSIAVRASAMRAVGGFDENLPTNADHDLCLRVMGLRPGNCAGIPDVGIRYRRRRGQDTSNLRRKAEGWERLLDKHRSLSPDPVIRLAPRARAAHQRALAAIAYEDGAFAEARKWMGEALREAPAWLLRDRRTWITGAAVASTLLPDAFHLRLEHAGVALLRALRSPHRDPFQ